VVSATRSKSSGSGWTVAVGWNSSGAAAVSTNTGSCPRTGGGSGAFAGSSTACADGAASAAAGSGSAASGEARVSPASSAWAEGNSGTGPVDGSSPRASLGEAGSSAESSGSDGSIEGGPSGAGCCTGSTSSGKGGSADGTIRAETAEAPSPRARGSHRDGSASIAGEGSASRTPDAVSGIAPAGFEGLPSRLSSGGPPSQSGVRSFTSPAFAGDSFVCRSRALNKGARTARRPQLLTGAQHMGLS
jgi:hypothetical protein